MGVSGYFDRSAGEAAPRIFFGPRFRDTDPRPLPSAADEVARIYRADEAADRLGEEARGLAALIPTRSPIAQAEDERLIESLAAHLYAELDTFGGEGRIATAIREWRDGVRGRR